MAAGPAGRSDPWSEAQTPKQAGWSHQCSESGHLVEDHTPVIFIVWSYPVSFFFSYPLHKVVYHLEMNKQPVEVFAKYNTEPSFSKYLPEKGKKKKEKKETMVKCINRVQQVHYLECP